MLKREVLDLLTDLTAFDTVSQRSNLPLIDYVEERLEECGFRSERVSGGGDRANVVARIGPDVPGGLMLAGHTDVVPVDDQRWTSDPFVLTDRRGRLQGRGTADMKGYLALVLEAAGRVRESRLVRPLYLAFTYDEEVGCTGARGLAERIAAWTHKPEFVLIGEPTEGRIVVAHKGLHIYRSTVRGRSAHSSRPDLGRNAILAAARLITRLEGLLPPERDPAFDPPASTLSVGKIRGGTATNIIPEQCEFDWELRPLPGVEAAALDREIARIGETEDGLDVRHEALARLPALTHRENRGPADRIGRILADDRRETRPFVTEAGIYQSAGVPAVVCGPGDIEQAHQPDESISVSELKDYAPLLSALISSLEGPG